jgi:hypothetical protein
MWSVVRLHRAAILFIEGARAVSILQGYFHIPDNCATLYLIGEAIRVTCFQINIPVFLCIAQRKKKSSPGSAILLIGLYELLPRH